MDHGAMGLVHASKVASNACLHNLKDDTGQHVRKRLEINSSMIGFLQTLWDFSPNQLQVLYAS